MNEEDIGQVGPEAPEEDFPLLQEAREIEKQMFGVMTTQVKLAIIQVVLATVSIITALIIALRR